MATILVAGGTGVAGRPTTAELLRRGHEVRVLSRHGSGAIPEGAHHVVGDLARGEALVRALDGVDVVIDTTDGKARRGRAVFTRGAVNLLTAARAAGVRRAVVLSIVNVERSAFPYYRAKREQELIYQRSTIDTRIVRATQFHQFVPMICAPVATVGIIPAFTHTRFQTIDTRDVARALADAAETTDPSTGYPTVVGGPEIHTMRELAQAWQTATGTRGRIVDIRMPGRMGAFLRAGANLTPDHRFGTITFEQWLADTRG